MDTLREIRVKLVRKVLIDHCLADQRVGLCALYVLHLQVSRIVRLSVALLADRVKITRKTLGKY